MISPFMRALLPLLLVFSTAYGQGICEVSPIAKELKPYVHQFTKLTGRKLSWFKDLRIGFHPLGWNSDKGGNIGMCCGAVFTGRPGLKIEIDLNYWAQADKDEKWAVMMHELGHCVCSLDHPTEEKGPKILIDPELYFPDTCPKTLMHPYAPSGECVKIHKKAYTQEFRKACKNMPIFPL